MSEGWLEDKTDVENQAFILRLHVDTRARPLEHVVVVGIIMCREEWGVNYGGASPQSHRCCSES